jgi:hypothetical protein
MIKEWSMGNAPQGQILVAHWYSRQGHMPPGCQALYMIHHTGCKAPEGFYGSI